MKVAVICNHEIALPALQALAHNKLLVSVAVADNNTELQALLSGFGREDNIGLQVFSKQSFKAQLTQWLDIYKPDVVLVMTSPFIIPKDAFTKVPYGFINFHYGLLPWYRGVNPVFEAIKRREAYGGITVHHIDEGIDTGPVILQQRVPIATDDTLASHMRKLGLAGVEATGMLMNMIISGRKLPAFPQNEEEAHYYKRPAQKDVAIEWNTMDAEDIVALVNACNPWNRGAATTINNVLVCITSAKVLKEQVDTDIVPGTVIVVNESEGLQVMCRNRRKILVEVVFTADGYSTGYKLATYSIKTGDRFMSVFEKIEEPIVA